MSYQTFFRPSQTFRLFGARKLRFKFRAFSFHIQLLSNSLNALSYFTEQPYHPSFSVLLKSLKSHMISMHIVSFQNKTPNYACMAGIIIVFRQPRTIETCSRNRDFYRRYLQDTTLYRSTRSSAMHRMSQSS